ncbi:MAG: hypothetical protein ACI9F9_002884 [Candidatus Paceibacteria bacterium]|jgi:hypothetical protein
MFSRSGKGGTWLVLLLALGAIVSWKLLGGPSPATATQGLNPDRVASGLEGARGDSAETTVIPTLSARIEEGTEVPSLPTFNGRGSIRGLVTTADGSPVPKPYTVRIGPSRSMAGREFAAPSSGEFSDDEFTLQDLPLGGYDLWVEAPGMNSRPTPVLLTEAATSPYLVIRISPMGFLDGFAFNEEGRPAMDLRVELAERDGENLFVTQTRPDGSYLFSNVPDGEYRLLFGPAHRPLVPERELAFKAPHMHFPKTTLPTTVDILIHTTDRLGKPMGAVTVSGYGKPKGRIEITTDGSGLGWARNLPPGFYRLAAVGPAGLTSKMSLDITRAENQEYYIAVR